jgi:hypothetical protein
LVALIVWLIPTTIGVLLAAIGIAGMDRALRANIIAKSGRAVETAGDIDTVLLDKTGTITLGARTRPPSFRSRATIPGSSVGLPRWPLPPIKRQKDAASSPSLPVKAFRALRWSRRPKRRLSPLPRKRA